MSTKATPHLTDSELFALALPAAGEPEALPPHLSECGTCGRALQAWKGAVQELARDDADPIERRSPAERRASEDATLAAIRRSRMRRRVSWRWAVGLAAALFAGAFLLPLRRAPLDVTAAPAGIESDDLSAADLDDDTLLRDATTLANGDSAGVWNAFPGEAGDTPRGEDSRL